MLTASDEIMIGLWLGILLLGFAIKRNEFTLIAGALGIVLTIYTLLDYNIMLGGLFLILNIAIIYGTIAAYFKQGNK